MPHFFAENFAAKMSSWYGIFLLFPLLSSRTTAIVLQKFLRPKFLQHFVPNRRPFAAASTSWPVIREAVSRLYPRPRSRRRSLLVLRVSRN